MRLNDTETCCTPCPPGHSWQLMPFAIACLAASNILIAIYSFRPTAKTSHTFGLCIVCGSHFVTTLQFAGVLQSINVPWTNLLLDVFQVSDLLFLDAKLLRPSCVSNLAPEMVFLGKVSGGILGLAPRCSVRPSILFGAVLGRRAPRCSVRPSRRWMQGGGAFRCPLRPSALQPPGLGRALRTRAPAISSTTLSGVGLRK